MKIIVALFAAALTVSAFSLPPTAHSSFQVKRHKVKKHKGHRHRPVSHS